MEENKILIVIIIKEEETNKIIAKAESYDFNGAMEELGKLERFVEKQKDEEEIKDEKEPSDDKYANLSPEDDIFNQDKIEE